MSKKTYKANGEEWLIYSITARKKEPCHLEEIIGEIKWNPKKQKISFIEKTSEEIKSKLKRDLPHLEVMIENAEIYSI